MSVVLTEVSQVKIPIWVVDLNSFRRWVHSLAVPEDARVYWVGGEVWVDMSNEQIFTHVRVKGVIFRILAALAEDFDLGLMLQDGALLSNDDASIGVNPDALFISNASREEGRVTFVEGRDGGDVEIRGTPDMVLEVVSRGSVTKDTEILFEGYWKAAIPEYWLVDARKSPARFDIYRNTPDGYVAIRRRDGWLKSNVFGRQFRFADSKDRFGHPAYSLEVK
jgi:Uma2 family endonuclease